MHLGDADATTGAYVRTWTYHSIVMFIFPRGAGSGYGTLGFRGKLDATGYTQYDVTMGSVVMDAIGKMWMIASDPQPWCQGDEVRFYSVDLKQMYEVPFPVTAPEDEGDSHFYGFERIDDGHMFEDGFERGWMP